MSATKALNKPLAQLDFKPLSNEIKALPYKANANLKAHLRDINAKTNELLDSMQEFKNTTKEIKLLAYNKPSENKAVEVDRLSNVLGDNFITKPNNDKPITDYQVTMEVEPYVRDLAKLKGSEIYADLQNLVNKHREMFDKPSDVFKLIKEIKKNPEFFYNNNRLDAALIVKRLSDNKIGKMGVKKDDGEVIHATKVREKDLIRLKKVSGKFADSVGIIQTFTQQGSKNDKSLNGLPNNEANPTTKQEISKEIESSTQSQSIDKPKEKTQIETLANMPHHPDDIKQIENLKAERQKLYDELAEMFDRDERQYFLNNVGTWYHTEEDALKRFNEIKQGLREGKGIRDVSSNTFNKNEYVTKVRQADVLNIEIDYLQIPRGLREKYPKVDKWLMGVLDKYTRKPEVFKERFGDVESFFENAASSSIEKALNLYPVNMIGGIGKKMGYDYAVKDKTFKKRLGELEYHREQIEALLDITPIAEFGKNYAEFYRKGQEAIQKLMAEKQGQVAGAFHRKELGDIDLVWGEVKGKGKNAKGYGLAKIIQDGEVVKTHNGYNITLGDYKVGLNIGWNENGIKIGENKWVVTAFDNSKLQSEKQGSNSVSFTKGETLPLNSKDIIPQTPQEIIKQAKQSGKSVKETKELIDKNKE
ncbi:hypothetical protein LS78_007280, partial [Helicobacter bilis]